MASSWLILDCNFLCHRAGYAFGGHELSHDDQPTSVAFGFLSDLIRLQERFDAAQVVFCFDLGRPIRKDLLPEYKAARHAKHISPEEIESYNDFHREVKRLWREILPNIGYQNILRRVGYEADDWIAAACKRVPSTDEAVIISADHDLFQCLRPNIRLYSPNAKKLYTLQSFRQEFGINPPEWIEVKAIAGCRGDEIPGAARIGEKTAIKFLKGKLKEGSKAYNTIDNFVHSKTYIRNIGLVRLPIDGLPGVSLIPDEVVNRRRWKDEMERLGMKSLVGLGPYLGRRKGIHG
jgi:5'-3' exonuclease